MCKLTKQSNIVKVLPSAKFFVSPLWPFGHVIKTFNPGLGDRNGSGKGPVDVTTTPSHSKIF